MNNTPEGINIWLDEAEDQISNLEDTVGKNTQSEQEEKKKHLKNKDSLRDLWDNLKSEV